MYVQFDCGVATRLVNADDGELRPKRRKDVWVPEERDDEVDDGEWQRCGLDVNECSYVVESAITAAAENAGGS